MATDENMPLFSYNSLCGGADGGLFGSFLYDKTNKHNSLLHEFREINLIFFARARTYVVRLVHSFFGWK